jgi:G:T-mismatch repair DNA endonuclease (very short patch repair protein)
MVRSDVWRDPSLPEDQRTFAQLDELGSRSFVVVPGCKTRLGLSAVDLLRRLVEDEQKKKRAEFLAKFRTEGSL